MLIQFQAEFGLPMCTVNILTEIGSCSRAVFVERETVGLLRCMAIYLHKLGLQWKVFRQDYMMVAIDVMEMFRVMLWGEVEMEMEDTHLGYMDPGQKAEDR